MDSTTFQSNLALALGDPANQVYTSAALSAATVRGVQAYSQYRPKLRRMATGNTLLASSAGDTQIVIAGGQFNAGDTVLIEPWTSAMETATVQTVSRYVATGSLASPVDYAQITLVSALEYAHDENAFVSRPMPGLSVQVGQDTYALPYDFAALDQDSFDAATGQKLSYRATNGFYDASSAISQQLSGVMFGEATNFAPSGYPTGPVNPAGCLRYRFLLGDPPQLVVTPIPGKAVLLDFYYWGCHTPASVPSGDAEAVLEYAVYAALTQRIGALSGLVDLQVADGGETQPSRMISSLQDAATAARAQFDRLVRLRPFAVTG